MSTIQQLFQELKEFSGTWTKEIESLKSNLHDLKTLPREEATDGESAQLNLLYFESGSAEEDARTMNSYIGSCLSLETLVSSFQTLYELNERSLEQLEHLQLSTKSQNKDDASSEQTTVVSSSPQPYASSSPTSSSLDENAAPSPSFQSASPIVVVNTPICQDASSHAKGHAESKERKGIELDFITPPPARMLNFDLLESENHPQPQREWASAGQGLGRSRTQRFQKPSSPLPSPDAIAPTQCAEETLEHFTPVCEQDLKHVSSYLLFRCTMEDINVLLKSVLIHLKKSQQQEIVENDLIAITSEKNRKTILLILKQLNRLSSKNHDGKIFYSLC